MKNHFVTLIAAALTNMEKRVSGVSTANEPMAGSAVSKIVTVAHKKAPEFGA